MSIICPLCNTEYEDDEKACPSCRALNPMAEKEFEDDAEVDRDVDEAEGSVPLAPDLDPLRGHVNLDDKVEQASLVPVFRAPTEAIANIIKGLLESEDIPVMVNSKQVPWMDGIIMMGEGFYGDLLVPESEENKARQVIEAYQPSSEPEEESH